MSQKLSFPSSLGQDIWKKKFRVNQICKSNQKCIKWRGNDSSSRVMEPKNRTPNFAEHTQMRQQLPYFSLVFSCREKYVDHKACDCLKASQPRWSMPRNMDAIIGIQLTRVPVTQPGAKWICQESSGITLLLKCSASKFTGI